jgi:hypothetical protein
MPEFLVEVYVSRGDAAGAEHGAERARIAAEELTREGTPICYLRSIFVPEDETCFYLYEAASAEDVGVGARRASLSFEHVAQAIAEPAAVSRLNGGIHKPSVEGSSNARGTR